MHYNRFEAKGDIEIKRWVLAFGRYAKVKDPERLKNTHSSRFQADFRGIIGVHR